LLGGVPAHTSSTSRALAPGSHLQDNRYVVRQVLGQGGMGAALLAVDNRLDGKLVVIKELVSEQIDPARLDDDVRNFKREVAMLAHIDHPLVPSVTDHFQEGTRYFMVQEYVEGENLEDRLEQTNQPMSERDALICAAEILDILEYLAMQTPPVVHRDIKPANIIIGTKDRRAHLVDFGIARAEIARNIKRKQTTALGTPGYAPPEQYQGNADPRSDLYALGATLHHVMTNRDPRNYPPFSYPPVRSLNPALSPETEQLLTRALYNDISQRYQSAASMMQDVEEILYQHFGVMGSINSYTLGSSGAMARLTPPGQANNKTVAPAAASAPTPPTLAQTPPPSTLPVVAVPTVPMAATPPGGIAVYQPNLSPGQQPGRNRKGLVAIVALLVLVLLGGAVFESVSYLHQGGVASGRSTGSITPAPTLATIGVTTVNGERIGISDGSYIFDTGTAGAALKEQAAQALRQSPPNVSAALSLFGEAVSQQSNDAEALIYQEDLRVMNSGSPYVTLVVGTMLSGDSATVGVGRDNLQGTYVAQKEWNDGAKLHGGTQVRLLIASSGSQEGYVSQVAQQIVRLAHSDRTFLGVMGWPFSSWAEAEIGVLAKAHIPMVSPTASSDQLTNASPYFFRVAPSNNAQGIAGAHYAEQYLHAKTVALFYDPTDLYSQSLAQDFARQFVADGNTIVDRETYTVGKPETLVASLQKALAKNPDLIYFSGYASDVSTILSHLPPGNLPVMGGDALYELSGYPPSARPGFSRLHFTSFAYPDEWGVLGYAGRQPAFFSEYGNDFDPNHQHPGYGFTRPDNDTILSYDATVALLTACNSALSAKPSVTPDDLRQALSTITGANALQGVSGQIAFGPDGNPINKALVILYVDPEGHIKMEPVQLGQFLK
jgi:serine/threonine protein kinase/ABC-type branched-subunit amino acid transport system substrate-binding protein